MTTLPHRRVLLWLAALVGCGGEPVGRPNESDKSLQQALQTPPALVAAAAPQQSPRERALILRLLALHPDSTTRDQILEAMSGLHRGIIRLEIKGDAASQALIDSIYSERAAQARAGGRSSAITRQ